jgi:hypothetical protein
MGLSRLERTNRNVRRVTKTKKKEKKMVKMEKGKEKDNYLEEEKAETCHILPHQYTVSQPAIP